MNRRRRLLLLAVCASAATLAAAVLWLWPREPVYEGKTLSEWLMVNAVTPTGARNSEAEAKATEAVRQIGTNALPLLLKWLDYQRPAWKDKLQRQLFKLPAGLQSRLFRIRFIQNRLFWPDRRPGAAIHGFRMLGEAASPAIPELTRRLNARRPDAPANEVSALLNIGDSGLPPLLAWLCDPKHQRAQRPPRGAFLPYPLAKGQDRAFLAQALGMRTWNAKQTIPALTQCLGDRDSDVASAALWSLFNLRSAVRSEDLVSAVAKGLDHADARVRASAARVLKFCGASAQGAVPALERALRDPDTNARSEAKDALAVIAPEGLASEGAGNREGESPKSKEP